MTGHRGKCTASLLPEQRITNWGDLFGYLGLDTRAQATNRPWATLGQALNKATSPALRQRYPLGMAAVDSFWQAHGRTTVGDLDTHLAQAVPCVDGVVCAGSGYGDRPMRPLTTVPPAPPRRPVPVRPAPAPGQPDDLLGLLTAGGGA